ncbi:MAG: NAD+ synthase, partial [Gammaproteobacteria bacterium]
MRYCRVGLAQINTTVGDIAGNVAKIRARIAEARERGCAIVAFPELAVTGYPPEDLVLRREFSQASVEAVRELAPDSKSIVAIVGCVGWDGDARDSAAVLVDGEWVDRYDKRRLWNYGVSDEERYFAAGRRIPIYKASDFTFAVSVCEDIWYPGLPLDAMALAGAELCININASPYSRGKVRDRERMLATRAADNLIALAYVNAIGGQDELVFDGASMVFDAEGRILARAPQFEEALLVVDIDLDAVNQRRLHDIRLRVEREARRDAGVEVVPLDFAGTRKLERAPVPDLPPLMSDEEEVWSALVLGTRDYLAKTGFRQAIIGMSGGIDSSVVATIAVDALGSENVVGVSLPSRYSSDHSKDDARELAERLGIRFFTIPIEPAHQAMLEMLADAFEGTEPGTAEENLQARLRGNVWMTLSNKFPGSIALTAGNKSEMATGYATLYGDMAGGYAVVKDVPKTLLYRLAEWRNRHPSAEGGPVIPEDVLTKPPSAELKPGQLDQDSLPPYEVLDPILEAYVEDDRTVEE